VREDCRVTRIVAGSAGGRRLTVPKGETTRPTSERVREALFSMLEARGVVRGARVLDLFSGSGALGLEAASRGAADVVLVDSSQHAVQAARSNVVALGLRRVTVVLSSAERYLTGTPTRPFDLVLLDPPYRMTEQALARDLSALQAGPWMEEDAVVVVERGGRSPEPRWSGLTRTEVRRYGDTTIWLAAAPDEPALRSQP
jgi:16S rRNA (guanine966-N2)-methyltransferase